MMATTGYRTNAHDVGERIDALRSTTAKLFAMPAVRRAVLSPSLVASLATLEDEIEGLFAADPTIHALASLEQAVDRLRVVRRRADEDIDRIRARRRDVAPPPAPREFSLLERAVTVAIEGAFEAQLAGAKVSRHGTGMLADLEHAGVHLWFAARGFAVSRLDAIGGQARVACRLRAGAPVGPRLVFRKRSGLERLLRARPDVALGYPLDDAFVVRGDPDLVAALLDRRVCDALASMTTNGPSLVIGDGVIELAWSDRHHPLRTMLPRAMLDVVTTIARRL